MNKTCQRCQSTFECNSHDIVNCNCFDIEISTETKDYLQKTSYDCLCKQCLTEVEKYALLKKDYPFPQNPNQFVEGIHYYIEGPYWVFTNYYHYLKGNCCKNNCRHCAYGYSN